VLIQLPQTTVELISTQLSIAHSTEMSAAITW